MGLRKPNERQAVFMQKYGIRRTNRNVMNLSPQFMDRLDRCADDDARRLIINGKIAQRSDAP